MYVYVEVYSRINAIAVLYVYERARVYIFEYPRGIDESC